jgi:ABC-type transport system involved in multi-copper enzyme maturation permease subunit
MYAWKYWRDTRARFLTFSVLWLGIALLLVFTTLSTYTRSEHWWRAAAPGGGYYPVWTQVIFGMAVCGAMMAALAGFFLGASGAGEEFERGTLPFLATRPRPRAYFVWTAWAVGAGELLVLLATGMGVAFAVLIHFSIAGAARGNWLYHRPPAYYNWGWFLRFFAWRIVGLLLLLWITALVCYSLAYLLTLIARSRPNGAALAIGLSIAYLVAAYLLRYYARISVPTPVNLFDWMSDGRMRWLYIAGRHVVVHVSIPYPFSQLAGWLVLSVAFVFAHRLLFERADV